MIQPFRVLFFLGLFISASCNESRTAQKATQINTSQIEKVDSINLLHFNHLYKEINIAGEEMGIVHIYSEAPDYIYTIEPKEGYTCVDDVARAVVMLSEYYTKIDDTSTILNQIEMMVKFILHMQNENGYYNNFIWNDYSINTTYKTTVAELNWWSLRALWALEAALPLLKSNVDISNKIKTANDKLVSNLLRDLGGAPRVSDVVNTISCPSWLPQKYGADQGAIMVLGLLPYYKRNSDQEVKILIELMCDGIVLMQKGDRSSFPFGAFMSWQNSWHAWGNSQSYALLKAGQYLQNEKYIECAFTEIDHFYPYLIESGYLSNFAIEKQDSTFIETERNAFSQIAYGFRPMIWATIEAYSITNELRYLEQAKQLQSWFFKSNVANVTMYEYETGRGYDGIISKEEMNRNAGAESTLESLMSMIKMQIVKN